MIVAIKDGKIVAAADLVSECGDDVLDARPWIGEGQVFYRPASPALAKAIEEGAALDSLDIVVGETADLAPDRTDEICAAEGITREEFALQVQLGNEVLAEILTEEAEEDDIRTIREHVLAKALENTK